MHVLWPQTSLSLVALLYLLSLLVEGSDYNCDRRGKITYVDTSETPNECSGKISLTLKCNFSNSIEVGSFYF